MPASEPGSVQSRLGELVEARASANQEIADVRSLEALRELARSAIERALECRRLLLDAHEQLFERDTELASVPAEDPEVLAKELARERAERRQLMCELQSTVEERTEWAQRLDRELAERTSWAQRLDLELTQRNELVDTLQCLVQQRTEWAQRLQQELAERDNVIHELRKTPWLWARTREVFLWLRSAWGRREIRRA